MSMPLRIIVAGLVGLYPVGGVAWDYLQYLIGLARLGHDVYYHEDTWSWPYQPVERTYTSDGSYSARFIAAFLATYAPELAQRWHYRHLHQASFGMSAAAFDQVARTADLFLNISGACMLPDRLSPRCTTVFLDTDPGYNQIVFRQRFAWAENVDRWCAGVADHDRFFTYAENINGADCLVPTLHMRWQPTRMPVVVDLWEPVTRQPAPAAAPWTTVMTWNAFKGRLMSQGVEYYSKDREFERLIDLPRLTGLPLMVAVGGVNPPVGRLRVHGWRVVDGPKVTAWPDRYQQFIAASRGELSAAKHVYAALNSGWFSCRSACYLAAGRPVVTQDTGFSRLLPTGEGLFAFRTAEEAVAALGEVEGDAERHARAARVTAEEHFDSDRVLSCLVDDAFASV